MTDARSTGDKPADLSQHIIAAITEARSTQQPLYINAGGSKRHLVGRDCNARVLDVSGHTGIVEYHPGELVITARAGTRLTQLTDVLHQQGQMLSFDPPLFEGSATLGGTLACNLSGPARPWSGSVRDMVLGVQLINGKGELLNFGGKVMKNVAGYDVSRLQAGALGTLGVLSEISLKVLPIHEHRLSLSYEMTAQEAVDTMNQRAGQPKPLQGAFWVDGRLYLRLAGAADAVEHTARQWGGECLGPDDPTWDKLREMTLPFFTGDAPLWRFSIKPTAPVDKAFGATLIDWGGAQRWVRGAHDSALLRAAAATGEGHVALFRGGNRSDEVRSPLNAVEQRLQQRLKHSFDPDGILNPGRLYSWL
jgi:glycolate oxidase FAD binding subunit